MVKWKKRGSRSVGWVQELPSPVASSLAGVLPPPTTIRISASAADCVAARLLILSREK
jgi:hypothetical protein